MKNKDGIAYHSKQGTRCADCHQPAFADECGCPPGYFCARCGGSGLFVQCLNSKCATHQIVSIALNAEHAEAHSVKLSRNKQT